MKSPLNFRLLDPARLLKPGARKLGAMVDVAALLSRVLPGGVEGVLAQSLGKSTSLGRPAAAAPADPLPAGATFVGGSFTNEAGTRPYKLYVPDSYRGQPSALIVMLHGCTQSPDDFAAGTRMNAAAEGHGCLVLYPGQVQSANVNKCWNWFQPADQRRGHGEPSLIAGMTREIMGRYAIDPKQVFIAGLSAGAAAAVILGNAYPELYAAIGVHSGLAQGAANDMGSAFAAMRQGKRGTPTGAHVPTIVFHGDCDATVNLANADAVVDQAVGDATRRRVVKGQTPGGHAFTQTLLADAAGDTVVEQWTIHGAGHAWSGGSPAGSYTDPHGPDATKEMLRFFLRHPNAAPSNAARAA